MHTGSELQFRAEYEGTGDLSLVNGYLLGVNGTAVGWTVCVEELEQSVVSFSPDVHVRDGMEMLMLSQIEWKGTDESCQTTYLQAVSSPPY